MSKVKKEDLNLGSGLSNDFDGAITLGGFGIKKEYAEKSRSKDPMLMLTLEGPGLDEPIEQAWGCGAAQEWKVIRDGKEVVSQKNPDIHAFNRNSRAGMLVDRMFQLTGEGDKAKGQLFFLSRDRYMTEGEFYEGLDWHWLRERMATLGGEERDVLMPVAFLGQAEVSKAPEIDSEVVEKVKALATGKTEKELKQAVLKDPELKANPQVKELVFKKNWLKALEEEGELAVDDEGKYVSI